MANPKSYDLSQPTKMVTTLDLVILLYHLLAAAKDSSIGFEDAQATLKDICHDLDYMTRRRIKESSIESAFWSVKMMEEKGQFWHPFGKKFKHWRKNLVKEGVLNDKYCWLEEK